MGIWKHTYILSDDVRSQGMARNAEFGGNDDFGVMWMHVETQGGTWVDVLLQLPTSENEDFKLLVQLDETEDVVEVNLDELIREYLNSDVDPRNEDAACGHPCGNEPAGCGTCPEIHGDYEPDWED